MRRKIKKMDCIEYLSVQAPLEKVNMLEDKQSKYIHEFVKRKEYPVRSRSNARMRELQEEAFYEEMLQREAEDNYPLEEDTGLAKPCMLSADISLEDQLANIGVSFHIKLVR